MEQRMRHRPIQGSFQWHLTNVRRAVASNNNWPRVLGGQSRFIRERRLLMNGSKALSIALAGAALVVTPMVAAAPAPIAWQSQNIVFLNGGIGEDEADTMRSRASEFPLRLIFAEGPQND